MRNILCLILLIIGCNAFAHDGNPNNKLLKFESYGQWEVWCIDYGASGDVRCDLSIVLAYQPQPNFRALIPRVYFQNGAYRIEFATESQTSLRRGAISVNGKEAYDFADCPVPCVLEDDDAQELLAALSAGNQASIRFHDNVVQTFDVEIDLHGLSTGLRRLAELQNAYRS